jgi:hypothetical protein
VIAVHTLEQITEKVRDNLRGSGKRVRMVGLLFARPDSPLAREEIIPSLQHYHLRSEHHIDFFCIGYGAWLPRDEGHQIEDVVNGPGRIPWQFDYTAFNQFVSRIEQETDWSYSDGVDLLLVNGSYDPHSDTAELDFSRAISLELDELKNTKALLTVERFFGRIFRFAQSSNGLDPLWGYHRDLLVNQSVPALRLVVEALLPKWATESIDGALSIAKLWIKDIRRRDS